MSSKKKQTKRRSSTTGADSAANESYTVLARRFRSRSFDELVGQEPIARTLKNAIASGRTAHAYLFCGTRGVGKTSMARIFACALNADDSLSEKDEIAAAIFRGDDLDVIEIDGASNRGIADAKDLIAGAGLSPARCRYKIYIIDEVHALTKDAFNALLKTMEEPPAHVKFILCTTEAHKVPATIQSRCQRFDFRPLPVSKISEQLRRILDLEGINADDDVIARVAQLGNGSMRDALSLLDRLLASGESTLTVELLEQMVGLPDQSMVSAIMSAIIESNPSAALQRADDLFRQGATVEQALQLLIEHFRALLVITACGPESDMIELAGESREAAIEHAKHFDSAGLVHLIAMCDAVERNTRHSSVSRALFDAALVRMCMSEHFASLADLIRGSASGAAPTRALPNPEAGKKKRQAEHEPVTPVATPPAQSTVETKSRVTEVKPSDSPTKAESGEQLWAQVINYPNHTGLARTRLDSLSYESFDGTTLRLAINEDGGMSARLLARSIDDITETIRKACGRRVDVQLTADTAPSIDAETAQQVENLPLVKQAMELFDARVVHVSNVT